MNVPVPLVEIYFDFDGEILAKNMTFDGQTKGYHPDEVAEDARESNVSFNYSGRHDHGKLPSMQSDDRGMALVGALHEAKAASGTYLTALINATVTTKVPSAEEEPAEKRART